MTRIGTLIRTFRLAVMGSECSNPIANRLLRLLRKERSVMLSLTSLGLTPGQAVELLTHPAVGAAQNTKGALDDLFDASDRFEGGEVIVWWNDIEKDRR